MRPENAQVAETPGMKMSSADRDRVSLPSLPMGLRRRGGEGAAVLREERDCGSEWPWGKCEVRSFPWRITENLPPSEALRLKAKEPTEDGVLQALPGAVCAARLVSGV